MLPRLLAVVTAAIATSSLMLPVIIPNLGTEVGTDYATRGTSSTDWYLIVSRDTDTTTLVVPEARQAFVRRFPSPKLVRDFIDTAARYKARAVPRGRLCASRSLRVAPLPRLPLLQGREREVGWLSGKQGCSRERKPRRSRRRRRTWEYEE